MSLLSLAAILPTLAVPLPADRGQAVVRGEDVRVDYVRDESRLLLEAGQVARAYGWKAQLVKPGKLMTLCRAGQGGFCVPLRLDEVSHKSTDDGVFVDAETLARVLRFEIQTSNGAVLLKPLKRGEEDGFPPAKGLSSSRFDKNRGFDAGQTVPDIPLFDLEGNEVRFSRFLGKQYIIYCWASW